MVWLSEWTTINRIVLLQDEEVWSNIELRLKEAMNGGSTSFISRYHSSHLMTAGIPFQGMAAFVLEGIWFRQLPEESEVEQRLPTAYSRGQSFLHQTMPTSSDAQTRQQIETKFHFNRDIVENRTFSVHYFPTDKMATPPIVASKDVLSGTDSQVWVGVLYLREES